MPLDQKLNKYTTASPMLVNFDFVEFASGTGFVDYYLMSTKDSTGTGYILDSNQNKTATQKSAGAYSAIGTPIDVNFDVLFNKTLTVKGKAITAITHFNDQDGSTRTSTSNMTINIIHVRGAVETVIGTVQSEDVSGSGVPSGKGITQIQLTQKTFKRGDTLRVNIVIEVTATGGSGVALVGFMHDPTGAAAASPYASLDSKSLLRLPLRI